MTRSRDSFVSHEQGMFAAEITRERTHLLQRLATEDEPGARLEIERRKGGRNAVAGGVESWVHQEKTLGSDFTFNPSWPGATRGAE